MDEPSRVRPASARLHGVNKWVAWSAIPLLAALALIAARWGWADIAALQPRAQMARWELAVDPPAAAAWQAVRSDLAAAHALEPGNPNLLEELARVYDWGALRDDIAEDEAVAMRRQSLAYYRLAVRQRPASPFGWSGVALLKYKLHEVDAEFYAALTQATALGPWEPGVQLLAAELGLAAWQRLPPQLRESVQANVQRGLKWQSAAIWRIAQQERQTDLVCAWSLDVEAHLPRGACQ